MRTQLRSFCMGALEGAPLSLPSLRLIALELDPAADERHAAFCFGIPLVSEMGAEGVCSAIGALVAAGVLPALQQVLAAAAACDQKGDMHAATEQAPATPSSRPARCRCSSRSTWHALGSSRAGKY
jgi:hypothetical protein